MGRMEEILVIILVAVVLFGSSKLPELGKSIGKAIKEFKDAVSDDKDKDKKA